MRIERSKLNWIVVCFGSVVDFVELIWEDKGWSKLLLSFCMFLSFYFYESNGECVQHEYMMGCLLLMDNVIFLDLFAQQYGYFFYEWMMWFFKEKWWMVLLMIK